MKHLISALATSLLLSTQVFSQDTLVTYRNADWENVKFKSEATHFRK